MSALLENLQIGSGWLLDVPGILIDDWSGPMLDVDIWRGQDLAIPGDPGQTGTVWVRDTYQFQQPFNLKGATLPDLYDGIAALRALFPTPLQTLTRRQTTASGHVDSSCNGRVLSLTWPGADPDSMKALDIGGLLTFANLDGSWT